MCGQRTSPAPQNPARAIHIEPLSGFLGGGEVVTAIFTCGTVCVESLMGFLPGGVGAFIYKVYYSRILDARKPRSGLT